ncbi:nuclear pore complex protein Nup107-like protein, partial [Euroglyphus maynei]
MDMDMEIEEDMRLRLNDSELVERVMEKNSMLREMQIIIDWLESMYDGNDDDESSSTTLEKMQFYSDGPAYWENTLHQLKLSSKQQQQRSMFMTDTMGKNSRILCQEMDPDAPIRNGQPLHDLDKEDENRLFHHLFRLIRSGRLPEVKEIAERFGYFWLSAALDGWIFHNDPNYNEKNQSTIIEQDELMAQPLSSSLSPNSRVSMSSSQFSSTVKQLLPIDGNPYRDLWKLSAWKCSKMDGTNLYERAIFSAFSGNRSVLMPLCNKWMDKLWAYFKCSLDVHLENLLIDTNISKPDMQPRSNIELPDSYWD